MQYQDPNQQMEFSEEDDLYEQHIYDQQKDNARCMDAEKFTVGKNMDWYTILKWVILAAILLFIAFFCIRHFSGKNIKEIVDFSYSTPQTPSEIPKFF